MKKTIIGGVVGGIVLWVWGFLAWVILPLHTPAMRNIMNEDAVIGSMRSALDVKSVYVFPAMPADRSNQEAMDAWTQKYRRGPTGMIIYDPAGSDPMMPAQMIVGLVIFILSAFLASWFLSRSTAAASSYLTRVIYCGMLGIFVSFIAHLSAWNWMGYPLDFTTGMMIDTVIGWLLAGLGIAAIVKAPKMESA